MLKLARVAAVAAVVIIVSACSAGSSPSPQGLLEKVMAAKEIKVSTDPQYPPQSELAADGSYQGFDIDVANEIGKRLGVAVKFETPSWDTITAGGWGGRWDMSVGSMTITSERQKVLDFSPPYYFTPAQLAASEESGVTTIEGLAGKTICVGEATTYLDWLSGTLDFGTESPQTKPPADITPITQTTDRLCAESWKSGRDDWQGWLTSAPTIQDAIADGLPVVEVGAPVYFEPLAVAVDKNGPSTATFIAKLTEIVNAMHSDGTLTTFSQKWYSEDLTKKTVE